MSNINKIKNLRKSKAESLQGSEYYLNQLKCTILWLIKKIDEYQSLASSQSYPKHYLDYHLSKLFVDSFFIDILAICELLYMSSDWIKESLSSDKEYVTANDLSKLSLKPLILWKFMAEWKKHPFKGYLDIGLLDNWKQNPTIEERYRSLLIKERDLKRQALERCQLWNGWDILLKWSDTELNNWCDEYKKHYTNWYNCVHYTKLFCSFKETKASDGKTLYIDMLHPKNADPNKWNNHDKNWFLAENRRREKNISEIRAFFAWLYFKLNEEKTKSLFDTETFKKKDTLWKEFIILPKIEKDKYSKIKIDD